jgi:hypothetical protein
MGLGVPGLVASHQSRFAVAHATVEQGLQLAHATGDTLTLAFILAVSGVLAYLEGNFALARSYSEESLRLGGHTGTRAMNLDNLGSIARRQRDYGAARLLHEQSLSLSRDLSDRGAVAQSLANLGHVARAVGDIPTARERYTESLLIRREIGDRHGIAMTVGTSVRSPNVREIPTSRVCGYMRASCWLGPSAISGFWGRHSINWQLSIQHKAITPRQSLATWKAFACWSKSRTVGASLARLLGVLMSSTLRDGRNLRDNCGTRQANYSIRLACATLHPNSGRTNEGGP